MLSISATNHYAVSQISSMPAQHGQEPHDTDKAHLAEQDDKKANNGLTEEESKEVEKLKARDREVRAHEQAHLAAAAGLAASGASYTYQRGPDGVSYAVGGEVKIDTSPGNTSEETIRRAQTIRAAALAPAEPSGQDRAVAAKAAKMEAEARAELISEQAEADKSSSEEDQDKHSAANNSNSANMFERHYAVGSGSDNTNRAGSLLNLTA